MKNLSNIKMNKKTIGVIYAIPEKVANRIFNEKKDIFVKFLPKRVRTLKLKLKSKFLIYASKSNKRVIGEATIKNIEFMDVEEVLKKYDNRIFLNKKELEEYSLFREDRPLLVLTLYKIKKYELERYSDHPITMGGKYLTQSEYKKILKRK